MHIAISFSCQQLLFITGIGSPLQSWDVRFSESYLTCLEILSAQSPCRPASNLSVNGLYVNKNLLDLCLVLALQQHHLLEVHREYNEVSVTSGDSDQANF